MNETNDRLSGVLAEAAKRLGLPVEGRKRGRPRGPTYRPQNRTPKAPKPGLAADEAATLRDLLIEQTKRRLDGLRLYKPMPIQQEFHESNSKEKLIRGANRSGKTTAAAVEVARAVTGQDPRYPSEGIAYLVGKDGKEMAQVMYRMLFRAGAVKIIRDVETGEWRSFDPISDSHRAKEVKPAPPLIPHRFIKAVSWEKKAAGVPEMIRLHNGWEIHCYSSNALPPHGTQIDLAWFDEEILNTAWYSEVAARLVDRNGRFIWSATPQAGTVQLYELHERADEQLKLPKEKRTIEEFVVTIADNVHLTKEQKDEFESKLSPDEVQVRIFGEFASKGLLVFPEFGKRSHICDYFDIPTNWTKYAAVDPGRQTCAVLFLAVPPEEDHFYAFDELYLKQCSAELFGQRMRDKTRGYMLEAMIIDHQEGRKAETGSGLTVENQYSDALAKYGIQCRRTGSEFTPGTADPQGGVEAVRGWLRGGPNGPKLRILDNKCANFVWEMSRYWYERDKDKRVTDKPRDRGPVHLCACIRYLAQDRIVYVKPPERKAPKSPIVMFMDSIRKKKHTAVNLGPGSFTIGIGS